MEKIIFIRLDSQKSYRDDDIEQINKAMDKGWEWSEYKQMKNGELMLGIVHHILGHLKALSNKNIYYMEIIIMVQLFGH